MLGLASTLLNKSYQWQPTFVGGDMKLWLRNGVGVAVGQWDDSSGNGNNAVQGTSGDQAAVSGGGLDFEGSNEDHYDFENDIVIAEGEAFALFIVITIESFDSQNSILGTGDNNVFLEFQTDRRVRFKTASGTDIIQYASNTFKTAQKMVIGITRTSGGTGDWKLYKNGDLETAESTPSGDGNNTGAFTFNQLAVRNSDRFFDGIIYEMIVYDTTDLTDSEVGKVNNYLLNKHGF